VKSSHRVARIAVLFALTIAALSACKEKAEDSDQMQPVPVDTAAQAAARPFLCGDEDDDPLAGLTPDAFVAAFKARHGITPAAMNEAHDCQQLIVSGSPRDTYGPMATFWVEDSLPGPDGYTQETLVALIKTAVPVPSLKLNTVDNCVYIKRINASNWAARIASVNGPCPAQVPNDADTLEVTDYPPTGGVPSAKGGRIHEGPSGTYYFGFLCLPNRWCVVGTQKVPGTHSIHAHARGDRQRLSVKLGGQLVASNLMATLNPVPNLASITRKMFEGPKGAKVATIAISGNDTDADTAYLRKWKINEDTLPHSIDVWLRRDTTGLNGDTIQGWKIRYTDSGTEFPRRKQTASNHAGIGVVRWRWSKDDEGVWIQCVRGCCSDW
jgi:hypothetical protein